MKENINYAVIAIVVLVIVIVFIIFFFRNGKDKKEFQDELEKTDVDLGIDSKI